MAFISRLRSELQRAVDQEIERRSGSTLREDDPDAYRELRSHLSYRVDYLAIEAIAELVAKKLKREKLDE